MKKDEKHSLLLAITFIVIVALSVMNNTARSNTHYMDTTHVQEKVFNTYDGRVSGPAWGMDVTVYVMEKIRHAPRQIEVMVRFFDNPQDGLYQGMMTYRGRDYKILARVYSNNFGDDPRPEYFQMIADEIR